MKVNEKNILEEVENTLSPEFINSIDDVCVFSPLTRQEVRKIAVMHLDKIKDKMFAQGKHLSVSDETVDALVERGFSSKYGARFLKRAIDDMVKVPITLKWKESDFFGVSVRDGEVLVEAASAASA